MRGDLAKAIATFERPASWASRLDDDEAGSGGVAKAQEIVPIAGHDPGLLGNRDGDNRRVHNVDSARQAEELPDGVSGRLIEGENLAASQQAPEPRLTG